MLDYFATLGLSPRASDREIREAYRRLAKLYHPDTRPDTGNTGTDKASTGNSENARRMQELNDAKSVLFDPVKREEHRVMLGLREQLSTKHIEELRNDPRFRHISKYNPPPRDQRPRSPWDKKWRKYFIGIVGAAVIVTLGVSVFELLTQHPKLDTIRDVIARYKRIQPLYVDSAKFEIDTASLPDEGAPKLKRKGDIFFNLGEYRSAVRYYEKYLQHVPNDDTVLRNLSFAYFRRGRYAESLDVLSRQMHGDSNLVVAYYNIGKMFLADEKPFDARDAFAESVRIADSMRHAGRIPPDLARSARSELAKLE